MRKKKIKKDKLCFLSFIGLNQKELNDLRDWLSKFVEDKEYDIVIVSDRKAEFLTRAEIEELLRR